MTFYTYFWLRENGTPYYVGKGTGDRAFTSRGHRVKRPKHTSRILNIDLSNPKYPKFREYAKPFLIAAIHLASGEYLEVVDVPRD